MPAHAIATGSAAAGLFEGIFSGYLTGNELRRQRTFDRQDAEEVKLKAWEANRILAIKSYRRMSFLLGVAVGTAYATFHIYIERILAFLTRSVRALAGLQPPMRRSL